MTPRSRGTKLARWMHLLEALLGRRTGLTFHGIIDEVPGYAIAEELRHGTSAEARRAFSSVRRTFERDKDELRAIGIPLLITQDEDDEYVYALRRRDFYLPYLAMHDATRRGAGPVRRARGDEYSQLPVHTLTPDVLAAIVEGAIRATEVGDARLASAATQALRTLALDLPVDALRQELGQNAAAPAVGNAAVLDCLDSCVAARRLLRLTYHGMRDAEARPRDVEPLGIFLIGNTWYLAARDGAVADAPVKNFRVSRVAHAEPVGDAGVFEVPDSFDLAAHARSKRAWDLGDGDAMDVQVRFGSTLGVVQAAAQLGEPVEGDAMTRRFRVRRPDAFVRWVLALAPHARIVAPAALTDELHALAETTRQHHAGDAA